MVFKIGSTEVINNEAAVIHESFPQIAGTTQSTEVKITASDGAGSDNFGHSVAVGSGRIVVGSIGDDDGASAAGSAYIFDLNGNQLAKITASDGLASDNFGDSVAVGCGRIVVGARLSDGAGSNSGSAYIYDLNGNQLAKITASDAAAGDQFGATVAVGSGRIVVGAILNDDAGSNSGSAYIYDLDGNQLAKITASDGAVDDRFGAISVGCGRIVAGAFGDNSATGSAYIFDLNGTQLAKITASDAAAGDSFGGRVAVGSGRIVVSAGGNDDGGTDSGSAYIFDLNGTQLAKITASDAAAGDQFGGRVAVGSGRIVVGADDDDDAGTSSGSAYIFDLDGNQLAKITASDAAASDFFGDSVAVGCGRIVVGSRLDDDLGSGSGSAYIYSLSEDHNTYWERILDTYKY